MFTSNLPYQAPELCLGEPANCPVDLWAYGCVLEELAHRRTSFHGQYDYDVIVNIFKRFGTPSPPHSLLSSPWCIQRDNISVFKGVELLSYAPSEIIQGEADAVPLAVAAVSRPVHFRALLRGLLQLAPDERMTYENVMYSLFCDQAGAHRVRGCRSPR